MISQQLRAALSYAQEEKWPIFPVAGKRPLVPHGFYDASTDPAQIRRWWQRWQEANIALPTGRWTGVIALDVDIPHGGMSSLKRFVSQYGRFPKTRVSRTGNGYHFLFQAPRQGLRSSINLGHYPGLDLKADGGYIVLPPSLHANGSRYEWRNRYRLAPCPAVFFSLVHNCEVSRLAPSPGFLVNARRDPAVFVNLALSKVTVGSRNTTGYWLACRLHEQGMSWSEAVAFMHLYVDQVPQSDHPYPVQEALRSLASAWSS